MRLTCVFLTAAAVIATGANDWDIERVLAEANRLRRERKLDEAERLYQSALEKTQGARHAKVLNNLAALLYDRGSYTEAQALYAEALRFYELDAREDQLNLATTLTNLGEYTACVRNTPTRRRCTGAHSRFANRCSVPKTPSSPRASTASELF